VLGNWILQRWQQRNWVHQQHFLAGQKKYDNLKSLCEDILESSNGRLLKMRRLVFIMHGPEELIRERLKEYDSAQENWNHKLGIFLVKLRFYAAYEMATRLEKSIQLRFVATGSILERLTNTRLKGLAVPAGAVNDLERQLQKLNGSIVAYNRDLMGMLAAKENKVYYGKEIYLGPDTLKDFPTWELIKALFKPRIERHSIVRSPTEF
jgi:hypothetical protein